LLTYTPMILDRSRNERLTVNDSSSTLPLRRKSPLRAHSTAQLTQTNETRVGEDLAQHLRVKYKRKLGKRLRYFEVLLSDLAALRPDGSALDFFRRKHP